MFYLSVKKEICFQFTITKVEDKEISPLLEGKDLAQC